MTGPTPATTGTTTGRVRRRGVTAMTIVMTIVRRPLPTGTTTGTTTGKAQGPDPGTGTVATGMTTGQLRRRGLGAIVIPEMIPEMAIVIPEMAVTTTMGTRAILTRPRGTVVGRRRTAAGARILILPRQRRMSGAGGGCGGDWEPRGPECGAGPEAGTHAGELDDPAAAPGHRNESDA